MRRHAMPAPRQPRSDQQAHTDRNAAENAGAEPHRHLAHAGDGRQRAPAEERAPAMRTPRAAARRATPRPPAPPPATGSTAERRSPDDGESSAAAAPPVGRSRHAMTAASTASGVTSTTCGQRAACPTPSPAASAQHHACRRPRRRQHDPRECHAEHPGPHRLAEHRRPVAKCEANQDRKHGEAIGAGKAANQRLSR